MSHSNSSLFTINVHCPECGQCFLLGVSENSPKRVKGSLARSRATLEVLRRHLEDEILTPCLYRQRLADWLGRAENGIQRSAEGGSGRERKEWF